MSENATAAQAVADLTAAVAAETTVDQSVVTFLNGIPALIAAAVAQVQSGVDPTAVETLVASLSASTSALSAALVANTPAAPAPVVPAA